jgi:hypothetical protein
VTQVVFSESDLVRVRDVSGVEFSAGIILDTDPSQDAPTYYLISVAGRQPDWYHEDEVYPVYGGSRVA